MEEFFDKKKETALLTGLTVPFLMQAFRQGVDLANQQGAKPTPPEDVFTAKVRKAIEEKSLTMSAQAVETTEEALRKVLLQAHADGVGVRELARRINTLYGESMGYRSLRIARTELTGSINDGALRTYVEQGYAEKQWSTVMDGHERDAHGEADGQVVPIDEPFQVGGSQAMYPGDPSLPPELLINCRCVAQPSGTPAEAQRQYNQMFLRIHNAIEDRFTTALKQEFQRQNARVRTRLLA